MSGAKLSTSALARRRGVPASQLFERLCAAGWIKKEAGVWRLLPEGIRHGGSHSTENSEKEHILWPEGIETALEEETVSLAAQAFVESATTRPLAVATPLRSATEPRSFSAADVAHQLKADAERLFSLVWLPKMIEEWSTGDSPPEELLALLLELILLDETRTGRMEVTKQEVVSNEKLSATFYKPDFIVRQRSSGAQMILECDGFTYHDRNSEQFERERRRRRELQRSGFIIYAFAATEIFKDPWGVGLEVVEMINDEKAQNGFTPISLPQQLLDFVMDMSTRGSSSVGDATPPSSKGDLPLPSNEDEPDTPRLDSIKKRICDLVMVKEGTEAHVKKRRRTHRRAYEPWSTEEDEWLVLAWNETQNIKALVSVFERQPGAVKTRVKRLQSSGRIT